MVTNQIGGGTVSIQSGATLGGNGGTFGGAVTVMSGGTLAPGLPGSTATGSLIINSNLTLSSGSVTRLSINQATANSDKINGVNILTYGGTLVVSNLSGVLTTNDSFHLFSAVNYVGTFATVSPTTPGNGLMWNTSTLGTDGTLRIAVYSAVATNPTNITAHVIGGNTLQLTWPADHTGWTLQVQTNSASVGLGTNWVPIVASTTTNQVTVPIVTANGCVFYRLVLP